MKSRTLLALTASALALEGVSHKVQADNAPTESTVSWRFTAYEEDDLDAAVLLVGSTDRYDIDIHQFRLLMPVGENYSLSLDSSHESMSGASPWYTLENGGSTSVVMSGATISEERRDFIATARRYRDNGTVGLSFGISNENDYESWSLGMDMSRNFNNELTTLAGGFSYASDEIAPSDAALFNRITQAGKNSRSLFVSITQIIDQNTLVQSGLSFTQFSGFLSDPYKLGDKRPDARTQIAWSTSFRHFFTPANAALHADYRYYHDDFGISSHTLDLDWYQNMGDKLQIVPGLRYYSQSAADFFRSANDFSTPGNTSSDYRLSAYGAWSTTLGIRLQLDKLVLHVDAERYLSAPGRGVHEGPASPALVDFSRLGIGFDYSF